MLSVTLVHILDDNYAYIIQSGDVVGVVDPGEAQPIIETLEEEKLTPSFIFNTHHHSDHIAGNQAIKDKYRAKIIAPEKDKYRITNIDQTVQQNDTLQFNNETIEVVETPGHTSGHICFYFPQSKTLFSGDTLFSMGCGRLFEGTAEQMFNAFSYFNSLPNETNIYCGHEYTLANAEFCLSIEPENKELQNRYKEAQALRAQNKPTIPTSIEIEKQTNIFMRAKNVKEFKEFRRLKDKF